jgi:hypothetical protein
MKGKPGGKEAFLSPQRHKGHKDFTEKKTKRLFFGPPLGSLGLCGERYIT